MFRARYGSCHVVNFLIYHDRTRLWNKLCCSHYIWSSDVIPYVKVVLFACLASPVYKVTTFTRLLTCSERIRDYRCCILYPSVTVEFKRIGKLILSRADVTCEKRTFHYIPTARNDRITQKLADQTMRER